MTRRKTKLPNGKRNPSVQRINLQNGAQVSCSGNNQQFGQGCEVGNAAWISVNAATTRADANTNGAPPFPALTSFVRTSRNVNRFVTSHG
jgi:hypothetical protein